MLSLFAKKRTRAFSIWFVLAVETDKADSLTHDLARPEADNIAVRTTLWSISMPADRQVCPFIQPWVAGVESVTPAFRGLIDIGHDNGLG